MARYTIDGQILTDIADVIRDRKGIEKGESYSASFGTRDGNEKVLSFPVKAGETYIVTVTRTDSSQLYSMPVKYCSANNKETIFSVPYDSKHQPKEFEFTAQYDDTGIFVSDFGNRYAFDITVEKILPKYTPEQMVEEISNISTVEALEITTNGVYTAVNGGYSPITVNVVPEGGLPPAAEDLTITGDCTYRFANNGWNWIIDKYGNMITTKDISCLNNMFKASTGLKTIPFDINCKVSSSGVSASYMFSDCGGLTQFPKINNLKPINLDYSFSNNQYIREIPEEVYNTWDWSYIDSQTSGYNGNMSNMFSYSYSLRRLPMSVFEHGNPVGVYSYCIYNSMAKNCFALDEIIDLPNPHYNATWTSCAFGYGGDSFDGCHRLKNLTFKMPDGAPYVVNWKSQLINLSTYIGYVSSGATHRIFSYNSGITADKEVKDDATYQALKNDPDWFTADVAYSRYNHDSAVATINSLPDTSAYLASAGGTNTIKFKGAAGSATDGGAINTLTESEIAVAAARGWTVSLV